MRWFLVAVVVVSLPVVGQARAQEEPSARAVTLAREQFRLGLDAVRAGDWESARAAFQRSLDLAPRPVTVLNLAGALAQTGRLVEAAELYRRYLREAEADETRQRADATRALEALERRVARLRVHVEGSAAEDAVLLDGEVLPPAALEVEMPVDPGRRVLALRRGGEIIAERAVTLRDGRTQEVTLRAPAPRGDTAPRAVGPTADDGSEGGAGSLLESPWFWVASGAGLAVAVTVLALVASGASSGPPPYRGNVPPGVWEVR